MKKTMEEKFREVAKELREINERIKKQKKKK